MAGTVTKRGAERAELAEPRIEFASVVGEAQEAQEDRESYLRNVVSYK